jgi:hypothetical protein
MRALSKASKWLYLIHECKNSKLEDLDYVLRNRYFFSAILIWGEISLCCEILLRYANRSM